MGGLGKGIYVLQFRVFDEIAELVKIVVETLSTGCTSGERLAMGASVAAACGLDGMVGEAKEMRNSCGA